MSKVKNRKSAQPAFGKHILSNRNIFHSVDFGGSSFQEQGGDDNQNLDSCSLKTEEFMTTKEASEFLKISEASLLNLSSNGRVPYFKFMRRNRYLKSDLLKLLLSNRRGGFNGN